MKPVMLFDLNMGQLPTEMYVLPLSGMVLMPEGKFSVRLNDVRQIQMIFAALAKGRMVAVLQQTESKKTYTVGCAARISGFNENEDNSLMVSLIGVCRFVVKKQFKQDGLPMIEVDYTRFAADFVPGGDEDKSALLYALDVYLKTKRIDVDVELLEKLSMRRLIATLASILPFDECEKQALIECTDLNDCHSTLLTILKMGSALSSEQKRGRKC